MWDMQCLANEIGLVYSASRATLRKNVVSGPAAG